MNLWFGVKFLTGILVLLTILGIPLLTAIAFYWSGKWEYLLSKEGVFASLAWGWVFLITYSLAMTSHCLLRQPIYAAISTLLTLWLGGMAFSWTFNNNPPEWLVATAMLASLAAAIALGWLAVRYDWGWKR